MYLASMVAAGAPAWLSGEVFEINGHPSLGVASERIGPVLEPTAWLAVYVFVCANEHRQQTAIPAGMRPWSGAASVCGFTTLVVTSIWKRRC